MGEGVKPEPEHEKEQRPDYPSFFDLSFPYYLSLGMTAKEFWKGDPGLVRAYRKAEELRRSRMNAQAWLQGMYFYNALCAASPAFHSLSPKEPLPYLKEPLPVTREDIEKWEDRMMRENAERFAALADAKNREMKGGRRES